MDQVDMADAGKADAKLAAKPQEKKVPLLVGMTTFKGVRFECSTWSAHFASIHVPIAVAGFQAKN